MTHERCLIYSSCDIWYDIYLYMDPWEWECNWMESINIYNDIWFYSNSFYQCQVVYSPIFLTVNAKLMANVKKAFRKVSFDFTSAFSIPVYLSSFHQFESFSISIFRQLIWLILLSKSRLPESRYFYIF